MKTGLVMEGGALKGVFSAGVTDELMERGISFDGAVGVSAGAIFGTNVKSRQIGRCIRYNVNYCKDPRYVSMRSLLKTGNLFGGEFCFYTLTYELDPFDVEAFKNNPMEFYSVCTDICTGKPVYYKCENGDPEIDMPWIQASSAMPLLARIVEINGGKYLDGGISDSIPLKYMENLGYKRNVVIRTKPKQYIMEPPWYIGMIKHKYRKYPQLVKAMEFRPAMYNDTVTYIAQREKQGDVYVFQPDQELVAGLAEHNPRKLIASYEHGREIVRRQWDAFRQWMKIKN